MNFLKFCKIETRLCMQRKLAGIHLSVLAAAALAACGGGGGSPGETHFPYTISLTANKTELPVNVNWQQPTVGIYATYTALLTAQVRIGNRAAPVGTAVQCNITRGLGDTAVLYRLDGEDETDTDENGNEYLLGSRELALETGAEGFVTFHAHSGDKAGEVQINCSATDPRDQRVLSAFQTITVGSTRQNVPARVRYEDQAGRYPLDPLGTNGNLANLPNSVDIRAYLTDDRSQAVSNTGAANLKVTIMNDGPGEPGYQARLLHGNRPAAREVDINTDYQGQAQFQLAAGNNPGPIIVRMLADRCDNNVANGTDDLCAIAAVTAIRAYSELPDAVLTADATTIDITRGVSSVTFGLNASGGLPPYTWGQAPLNMRLMGFDITPDGVFSGGTISPAGTYPFEVRVTDAFGDSVRQSVTLIIVDPPAPPVQPPTPPGQPPTPPVQPPPAAPNPPSLSPGVTDFSVIAGTRSFAFSQGLSGGKAPLKWYIQSRGNLPPTASIGEDSGILVADPNNLTTAFNSQVYAFILEIKDADNKSYYFNITMNVGGSSGTAPVPITMTPGANVYNAPAATFSHSFAPFVSGGVSPYTWVISGAPAGVTINSNNGTLTGNSVASGNHNFTLTVTGFNGAGQQFAITLTVP